ncbi:MAG: aminodeoxychorismate synthase component I [Candidatus Omnitrophota bacterium]|nr:MAG: aminodeoxychorismate synthase component I [Candidatus Omnitrophota bacterium]
MSVYPFMQEDLKKLIFSSPDRPFVFLETALLDEHNTKSFLFKDFSDTLTFQPKDNVEVFFERAEELLAKGFWLCGYFTYEFGYFLEGAFAPLRRNLHFPLAWLGACKAPIVIDHRKCISCPKDSFAKSPYSIRDMRPNISQEEYALAIGTIKRYLEEGLTYQVNFTFKMKFDFQGNPIGLYHALRAAQPTSYMALINTGSHHILSFSPELFFRKRYDAIVSRPMKGTVRRGISVEEDRKNKDWLKNSKKTKAENVMIVDLLRNDLGRISKKVWVPSLFDIEKYRTLYQMTSTIQAQLKTGIHMHEIFSSLFPCGSVTGAPKIKTMQIIRGLEKESRGVYTGSIGYFSPKRDACFNVAIRTIALEENKGELGIGGGIVYDSTAETEYREALLKARFLTERRRPAYQKKPIAFEVVG